MITLSNDKLRRIGSTYQEYQIVEKTGANYQEMIAGISGLNLVIKRIEGQVHTASTLFFCYSDAHTKVTAHYSLADKGSIDLNNLNIMLPAGEGLDLYTSADPNEGWFAISYDYVKHTPTY